MPSPMSFAAANRSIFMTGSKSSGFTLGVEDVTSVPEMNDLNDTPMPSYKVGNAIVRALRALAVGERRYLAGAKP